MPNLCKLVSISKISPLSMLTKCGDSKHHAPVKKLSEFVTVQKISPVSMIT